MKFQHCIGFCTLLFSISMFLDNDCHGWNLWKAWKAIVFKTIGTIIFKTIGTIIGTKIVHGRSSVHRIKFPTRVVFIRFFVI